MLKVSNFKSSSCFRYATAGSAVEVLGTMKVLLTSQTTLGFFDFVEEL
jgi:hypothetical protein